jgi:hypothetical protein
MKNVKYNFLICLVSLALFSCKKTTDTPAATASGAGSSNSTISPSNATSYYGIFASGKTQAISGGVLQPPNFISNAYFASAAAFFIDWTKVVMVDTVKVNGRILKYVGADYEYEDSTNLGGNHQTITFPVTWHVAGKNGIPSFTYMDNPFPAYTGYNLIPDTINHATGFTFSLSGVSNSTGISVFVDDGSLGHGSSTLTFMSNATSIAASSSDMAQLLATNTGNITITFNNKNVENVYGKAMNFQSSYTITKVVSIK